MKGKMRKLFAFALAAIMVLAMGITASAADSGKITVKGANPGTYYAYKVFDGTVSENGGMSYIVSGKALTYMNTQANDGEIKEGDTVLFTLVNNGGATYVKVENADAAAAWVQNHINGLIDTTKPDATATTNETNKTAVLENLKYGYYYVMTNTEVAGSAVMLTSVNGDVDINEKHGVPGFDSENPADGKHAENKTYQIGERIKYTIQYSNALNYVNGKLITDYTVEDTLATGIELVPGSVKVYVDNAVSNDNPTGEVDFVVPVTLNNEVTGTITWAKIVENADGTSHLEPIYDAAPSVITIEYEVLVTKDFVAGDEGVKNIVKIGYITEDGESSTPEEEEETVYTGKVEIEKVDGRDPKQYLEGAVFVIQRSTTPEQGSDSITEYMTKTTDAEGKVTIGWTQNIEDENVYKAITDENGKASFEGLKEGRYTLVEIEAPEGYNLLENGEEFDLNAPEEGNDTLTMVYGSTISNNKGTLLPSTGGIGTTIFYVVGGVLVVVAGILLITKKRMSGRD
jgi:LPXTG-motif cell wall-anchored protein/uncharacterized repeat protein (TIGR01451 family)|nr:SpaH/EbpB family LPXTG-anchored major pilin [uncultured Acetatifactor sp.]